MQQQRPSRSSPAVVVSGRQSREPVLLVINPSFAPTGQGCSGQCFMLLLICRRLRSRARRRTGVTGGGTGRANFPGVLPLKQFKNINHVGSRWLLERCSHTAGTVAGGRAACPGQESWQQALLWLVASGLASPAAFQVGAASSESRHQEVLT